MNNTLQIPNISFYFIRHGETDWNKTRQDFCDRNDIELNQTGIEQVEKIRSIIETLGITHIYSSPLRRTEQTAEIINTKMNLKIEYHRGLCAITDDQIAYTCHEILDQNQLPLLVSHGEVYRILLRILDIQTDINKAQNAGLYLFKPSNTHVNKWIVNNANIYK